MPVLGSGRVGIGTFGDFGTIAPGASFTSKKACRRLDFLDPSFDDFWGQFRGRNWHVLKTLKLGDPGPYLGGVSLSTFGCLGVYFKVYFKSIIKTRAGWGKTS
jgi:hypothetical protein